jgi:energy-coupling factor transport system ATP-binding protein
VIEDLSFSYFDHPVLQGASLRLDEGLVHLVLGCAGSGKTTLALIVAGLLRPSQGAVLVDGSDPASRDFDRSRVQLAFQFPENQIFESTVEREIEYGLRNFGVASHEIGPRCEWALECVGLSSHMLPRDPGRLSFGERRRVALASVIALRPKYLLLDEPLAGLDWRGRRQLVQAILRLRDKQVSTVILTHETDVVAELGDTISVLVKGGLSGPLNAQEYLYSDDLSDHLLPDFMVAVRRIQSAGFKMEGKPRRVADVAKGLIEALGLEKR